MPIWHDEHRGYRISYQGDRHAILLPPGSEQPLSDTVKSEPGDGRIELRRKAHAAIDEQIAATRESPAPRRGVA